MNRFTLSAMLMMTACMITGVAIAGGYGDDAKDWHHADMHHRDMHPGMMLGKHRMEGTVGSVDPKGWVQVKTGEGILTVHFPPDAIKDLKVGDTITVYLSFSKGPEKKGGAAEKSGGEKAGGMKDDKTTK